MLSKDRDSSCSDERTFREAYPSYVTWRAITVQSDSYPADNDSIGVRHENLPLLT